MSVVLRAWSNSGQCEKRLTVTVSSEMLGSQRRLNSVVKKHLGTDWCFMCFG